MPRAFDETELLERVDNDWEFLAETVQMLETDGRALLERNPPRGRRRAAAVGRSGAHAQGDDLQLLRRRRPRPRALDVEQIGKARRPVAAAAAASTTLEPSSKR